VIALPSMPTEGLALGTAEAGKRSMGEAPAPKATFFLACLAAMELEGVVLEEI
jgi:hypothetical protein